MLIQDQRASAIKTDGTGGLTMNPTFTDRRVALSLVTAVAFGVLALSSAASASPSSEQRQGGQIASEVQAGRLSKTALSKPQYERVGQYLMGRALGSTKTYEARTR
jgi:hypothetical protein